jgi:hypothetical protein
MLLLAATCLYKRAHAVDTKHDWSKHLHDLRPQAYHASLQMSCSSHVSADYRSAQIPLAISVRKAWHSQKTFSSRLLARKTLHFTFACPALFASGQIHLRLSKISFLGSVPSSALAGNYLSLETFFTPFYYHDELLRIQAAQRRVQVMLFPSFFLQFICDVMHTELRLHPILDCQTTCLRKYVPASCASFVRVAEGSNIN